MVFVAAGLLLGPTGVDLIRPNEDKELIRAVLELALVLVLFTDAMTIQSAALRRQDFVPIRLLAIGLPLTMLLGWLVAMGLLPALAVWEAALVAGSSPLPMRPGTRDDLEPTRPTVDPSEPERGERAERRDGPAVLHDRARRRRQSADLTDTGVVEILLRALVLSTLLGAVVGGGAGWLLSRARTRGWVDEVWERIAVVVIAIGAYGLAVAVDGSGFISAWVAGLAFGAAIRSRGGEAMVERGGGFIEDLGGLFVALSYLGFGAVLLGPVLEHLDWRPVAYAVVSLTLIAPSRSPCRFGAPGSGVRR
jgi:NhaP-type Na+/H+ or K+/H+ antiporter